jgi:hypothetical protein
MPDNQELSGKKEGFFAELKKSGSKWIGIIFITVITCGVIGSSIGAVIAFAIFAVIGVIATYIKGGGIKNLFGSKKKDKTQELSQSEGIAQSKLIPNEAITQSNDVDTKVSNTITQHTNDAEDNTTIYDDNQFLQKNKQQYNKENYDKSFEGDRVNCNNEIYSPSYQEVPHLDHNELYKMENEHENSITNQQLRDDNLGLYEESDKFVLKDDAGSEAITNFQEAAKREAELKRKAWVQI